MNVRLLFGALTIFKYFFTWNAITKYIQMIESPLQIDCVRLLILLGGLLVLLSPFRLEFTEDLIRMGNLHETLLGDSLFLRRSLDLVRMILAR